MHRPILLCLVFLVSLHVSFGGDSSSECPSAEYADNVLNYYNALAKSIKLITDKIKVKKFGFLKELNANFTKAFEKLGCGDKWNAEYTEGDRDKFMYQLMPSLVPPPAEPTIKMMKELEQVVWLMVQDHVLATCMVSVSRSFVIGKLSECTGKDILPPVDEEDMADAVLPDFTGKEEFLKNTRAAINMMGWALMNALNCSSSATDEVFAAVNEVSKATDEDFCYTASDSFQSDECYGQFQNSCPKIVECMDDVSSNLQKHAVQLFVDEADRFKKCLKRSMEFWSEDKPESVPKASTLLGKGLKHWGAIKEIKFSPEEKEASAGFFRALAMTILRPHSCHCEIPVPFNPQGEEEGNEESAQIEESEEQEE